LSTGAGRPGSGSEGTPQSLPAGRVGRPHGLDGSFYVTRPSPRLLTLGASVILAGEGAAAIVRRAGTDAHPIVRLEGVDSREAAEALRGRELRIEAAAAPALAEGEFWAHELEGCEVVDGALVIGTVLRMIELPSCEALEVARTAGGQPLIVPMVKDAVRSVDVEAKRIEIHGAFLGLGEEPPGDGGEAGRR
jgi:16S rRNA processing protein RimM